MKFMEPSTLKVGDKVFRGISPKLRPLDPKLDVGHIVEIGGPGLDGGRSVLVELHDLNGRPTNVWINSNHLEAIG